LKESLKKKKKEINRYYKEYSACDFFRNSADFQNISFGCSESE
jgi:hypothetical protein